MADREDFYNHLIIINLCKISLILAPKIQTRKTISDSRPTTNQSTLLTMFTLTGATEKSRENAMLQNIINFGAKIKRGKLSRIRSPPAIDPPCWRCSHSPEQLKKSRENATSQNHKNIF